MGKPVRRRTMLAYLGISAGTLLTGCTEQTREPWRMLTFGNVQVEEAEDGWLVTFELEKQYQAPDELGTFHDVRAHGYDENRSEVCMKEIGTITENYYGGNGLPVEMKCSASPTMLTYSAEESPCDEEINTIIDIAVYEDARWLHDFYSRDCNEGLPPEPREETDDGS